MRTAVKCLSSNKIFVQVNEKISGIPSRIRVNYETVARFRKKFRNYIAIYLSHIRNSFPIEAIDRSGEVIVIESQAHLTAYLMGLKFVSYDESTDVTKLEINGQKIKLSGLQYGGDLGVFTGAYNIDVRGRTVLDIGANIGDSAIHFINSGASRVIAVEADPFTFDILRRNVELNDLADKILPVSAAVSGELGILKIPYRNSNANSFRYPDGTQGVEVVKKTLESFIEEFKINSAVLKLDCEGCEYDAILKTDGKQIINAFDQIALEYHYGAEKINNFLKELLYTVESTPERRYYNKNSVPHIMHIGMIHARKQ
jgi:FkbM family methyltransferase